SLLDRVRMGAVDLAEVAAVCRERGCHVRDSPARNVWNGADRAPEDIYRPRAVDRRPVAELTGVVRAPALGRTGARQRAGVGAAGDDCGDAGLQAADVDRRMAVGRRAASELAGVVAAPALDSAAGGQCAAVLSSGRDRRNAGEPG